MKLPPVLGMDGGDYINASFIDVSKCLDKIDTIRAVFSKRTALCGLGLTSMAYIYNLCHVIF